MLQKDEDEENIVVPDQRQSSQVNPSSSLRYNK